jgi:septum site-determining protein MinD
MKGLVALHSYKGGTGKTSICANLAAIFAKRGHPVCLLDFDFRAPSLHALFKAEPKAWLNDYLDGKCELDSCLLDFSAKLGSKAGFKVAFANPSLNAIREMMAKDRKWEVNALHRSLTMKSYLGEQLKVEYAFLDTSPGVHFSSMNALAASDFIILVMKMDDYDTAGTKELIEGLYEVLGKNSALLINRISNEQTMGEPRTAVIRELRKISNIPLLGMIPCFCDLGDHELSGGRYIYAIEKPDHVFTRTLTAISEDLERNFTPAQASAQDSLL